MLWAMLINLEWVLVTSMIYLRKQAAPAVQPVKELETVQAG